MCLEVNSVPAICTVSNLILVSLLYLSGVLVFAPAAREWQSIYPLSWSAEDVFCTFGSRSTLSGELRCCFKVIGVWGRPSIPWII